MVEPTESESLAELDRFCEAMIAIRDEIAQVEQGVWPRDDNPLKHAPHTAEALLAAEWTASLPARAGRLSARDAARQQVLVAGRPGRQRLGRPQPLLLLPAALGLRGLTRRSKTGTGYACSATSQPRAEPMTTDTLEKNVFSHVKPADTAWRSGGLRDFFLYKDLGIEAATGGRVIAQLVKANQAPEKGTGWHRHEAQFHIVLMLKGWARFMYGNKDTLVEAGDCVHQRPGIVHFLYDYSPDMEYLEVVGPADFSTVDMPAPAAVPDPTPW